MILRVLAPLYYLAIVALAVVLVRSSEVASAKQAELSMSHSPSAVARSRSRELLRTLTFGLLGRDDAALQGREQLTRGLARAKRWIGLAAQALLALAAGFLVLHAVTAYRAAPRERAGRCRALSRHLLGTAAVFLGIGALAPILTIVTYQDLPVLGRVVFGHESKSLLGTVSALARSHSWLVAGLLALFSLALPLVKLGLSVLALGLAERERGRTFTGGAQAVLHHLGKWSMTDVFVVAILVAFLSAEQSEATAAFIGIGLYFFAGYTVLSVLASMAASGCRDRG